MEKWIKAGIVFAFISALGVPYQIIKDLYEYFHKTASQGIGLDMHWSLLFIALLPGFLLLVSMAMYREKWPFNRDTTLPEASADLPIFRWWCQGRSDHFYTQDASGEQAPAIGYTNDGLRFKLFPTGIIGTRPFYRLFSETAQHHFYTADPIVESALSRGYQLEGIIGNIAPNRLIGTTPLYRWFNPTTGDHFYTIDPLGELAPTLGYHFEEISGYVLPQNNT